MRESNAIVKLMTTEALIWTLAGVGIGLSAASRVVRVLSALIYGIEGTDPIVYAAIILLLPGGRAGRHLRKRYAESKRGLIKARSRILLLL